MLQIQNFSLRFPKNNTQALQNVSYTLSESESVGVVGESGSGKSLTALAILGLLPKCEVEGNIWFQSKQFGKVDLLQISENQKKQLRGKEIGMVFQEPMSALNPVFRCGYQVEEAVRLHHPNFSQKDAKNYTLDLLKKMQIPNPEQKYYAYPHELSGGQKQRFVIAIALAGNPSLLIADEPTTALDVTVQKEILDLLKNLQQERNMSFLFISHDWGVVNYIAQKVVVMFRGKKLEENAIKNILENPQHDYTKELLGFRSTITLNSPLTLKGETIISEGGKNKEILKISGLDFSYPTTNQKKQNNILSNINLSLSEGEILGLVGESGSGKSTIGKLILRLEKPTKGEILFCGENIFAFDKKKSKNYTQQVQMVFQDAFASLNPKMQVSEILSEPFYIHRDLLQKTNINTSEKENLPKNELQKRILTLLELVQLPANFLSRYSHELSGGQRQRVNIARSLAFSPKILVADESTASLDVSIQAQILELLKNLQKELSLSMIFISHDLAIIQMLADNVGILEKGVLVEYGDKNNIFQNPFHPYTKKLLEAVL